VEVAGTNAVGVISGSADGSTVGVGGTPAATVACWLGSPYQLTRRRGKRVVPVVERLPQIH